MITSHSVWSFVQIHNKKYYFLKILNETKPKTKREIFMAKTYIAPSTIDYFPNIAAHWRKLNYKKRETLA